ncbi:MAG: DNA-protecting protein DprA [Chloroflexi bacterium AL-W]|nr:DNA-protecting protein DprA [Chloroflexi bacterium AL-W]
MQHDAQYWLGFSLIPNIGGQRIHQLLHYFKDLTTAWKATEADYIKAGIPQKAAKSIVQARSKIDLQGELNKLTTLRAHLITWQDEAYPAHLRPLDDAPPLLYVRGALTVADEQSIAVVGTRKVTKHGRDTTFELCKRLAQHGVTIVSGLAHGVDTAAHQGALAGGGRTIAVLGNGVDKAYPPENRDLARRIVSDGNGAVISEFPIGTPPHRNNFPRRNRIISGMSLALLITEAPLKSGALITAEFALEQGRDVFAVPGGIHNQSAAGTNRLIQEGAKLVMNERDILDELQIRVQARQTKVKVEQVAPSGGIEQTLLNLLGAEPVHIDEIVRLSQFSIADVSSTLTILELKGLAEMVGHMQYSRTHTIN